MGRRDEERASVIRIHGNISAYQQGCSCVKCKLAWREYQAERRAKKLGLPAWKPGDLVRHPRWGIGVVVERIVPYHQPIRFKIKYRGSKYRTHKWTELEVYVYRQPQKSQPS